MIVVIAKFYRQDFPIEWIKQKKLMGLQNSLVCYRSADFKPRISSFVEGKETQTLAILGYLRRPDFEADCYRSCGGCTFLF